MTLRFSLLSLIGLVSWAALASAALVHPGSGWLSVVVTLTAAAIAWQLLRAVLTRGSSRAAAAGWLVFAVGYLAIARGPWLGQTVGPQLISTQALNYAQVNWRKEDPHQAPAQPQQWIDLSSGGRIIDGTSNTLIFNGGAWTYSLSTTTPTTPPVVNWFQLSGHWLFTWLAGWLGAAVAVHCERRRRIANSLQAVSCTMPLAAGSAPPQRTAPP
jgi:hypothetical protein